MTTLVLATLVVLGACSSDSGDDDVGPEPAATDRPGDTGGARQPCEVLTPELAGDAIGIALREGDRLADGNTLGCEYFTVDDSPVAVVFHEPGVGVAEFVERIQAGRAGGSLLRPAESLADVTFWADDRRATVGLVGGEMIQVFLVGPLFTDEQIGPAAGRALLDAFVSAIDPIRIPTPSPSDMDDEVLDPKAPPTPITFADNVAAGVESGAWGLGEGISLTLRAAFAYPGAAGAIAPSVEDDELTELLAMAADYVSSGTDEVAIFEITAVFDDILWTPDELEAMVVPGSSTAASADGDAPASMKIAYSFQEDTDCAKFFPGKSYVGIEECLARETVSHSGVEFRIFGPDPDDRRLRPDPNAPDPPPRWESKHYEWTKQAVRDAIVTYQPHGIVPDGYIVLSQLQTSDDGVRGFRAPPPPEAGVGADRTCYITLLPHGSYQAEMDFRHTVVHEIAHCFQGANVEARGYPRTKWVVESMAEYFANLVYPENNKEQRERHPTYMQREVTTTIFERAYDNASWIQHYANRYGGAPAVTELLRAASNGDRTARDGGIAYMTGSTQYAAFHHDFAQKMTEGSIKDSGPGNWPNSREVSAGLATLDSTALAFHVRSMNPYSIDRIMVRVPAGKKATILIRSEPAHEVSYATWSGGTVGQWQPAVPSISFDVDCESRQLFFIIATTTNPAEEALVYDALVEDGCEEEPPEVIDAIDSCLIGQWDLNMQALLGEIKLTDVTVRDAPGSSIEGSVTLEFRADKTLTIDVDGYEEIHDYGDGRAIKITSKGKGDEEWGADGTRLNALGISGTFDYRTEIEATIFTEKNVVEGPPEHVALLPFYQTYFCTANALTIFSRDGFTTNWTR